MLRITQESTIPALTSIHLRLQMWKWFRGEHRRKHAFRYEPDGGDPFQAWPLGSRTAPPSSKRSLSSLQIHSSSMSPCGRLLRCLRALRWHLKSALTSWPASLKSIKYSAGAQSRIFGVSSLSFNRGFLFNGSPAPRQTCIPGPPLLSLPSPAAGSRSGMSAVPRPAVLAEVRDQAQAPGFHRRHGCMDPASPSSAIQPLRSLEAYTAIWKGATPGTPTFVHRAPSGNLRFWSRWQVLKDVFHRAALIWASPDRYTQQAEALRWRKN